MTEAIAKTRIHHKHALVWPGETIDLDHGEYLRLLRSGAVESAEVARIRAEAEERIAAARAEAERDAQAAEDLIKGEAKAALDEANERSDPKRKPSKPARKPALATE
jgi:hypothetical protein